MEPYGMVIQKGETFVWTCLKLLLETNQFDIKVQQYTFFHMMLGAKSIKSSARLCLALCKVSWMSGANSQDTDGSWSSPHNITQQHQPNHHQHQHELRWKRKRWNTLGHKMAQKHANTRSLRRINKSFPNCYPHAFSVVSLQHSAKHLWQHKNAAIYHQEDPIVKSKLERLKTQNVEQSKLAALRWFTSAKVARTSWHGEFISSTIYKLF